MLMGRVTKPFLIENAGRRLKAACTDTGHSLPSRSPEAEVGRPFGPRYRAVSAEETLRNLGGTTFTCVPFFCMG